MKKGPLTVEEALEEDAGKKELVLRALGRSVPAEAIWPWLHTPNLDLGNRTPEEAMEEGDFGAVIDALWLQNPAPGPVS